MRFFTRCLSLALLAAPLAPFLSAQAQPATRGAGGKTKITWKKTVIDKVFRAEGVGVADFNKDGKMDIFVGDVWYEAPDWKMHEVRSPKTYDGAKGYSESFACFTEDFDGDGYPDAIVIPFPGQPCYWYQNPGPKGGHWPKHLLATSACNETPIYVDLFGKGKKVLVMGWQPPGKNDQGQMCYFTPGKDPTQPWEKIPISEPSQKEKDIHQTVKEIPGTRQFSHGLGHGDVNGDGRTDIIIPDGWWEQPEKPDGITPWKFHPIPNVDKANRDCADMFTYDIDGDGKADIVSSSAHLYGLWWHHQLPGKDGSLFIRRNLFAPPPNGANLPKDHKLTKEELALYNGISKQRNNKGNAPWRLNPGLTTMAHEYAAQPDSKPKAAFKGKILQVLYVEDGVLSDPDKAAESLLARLNPALRSPALEIGVGYFHRGEGSTYTYALIVADTGAFSLPAQTHALHCVDINGDGLKDLVTGRRWWAHGPKGDAGPNDPAYLYWFEAARNKDGFTTFIPHEIDDDSGIGTQFAVADVNGDGLPDIIISNKKGVFLFIQVREFVKE